MPKISVIVPVYKAEKYVAATINSVLNQTYTDFEIIIIDDESPDRSIAICQEFTDNRIKIVHQQNRGLAGARNTGIRHAQGEYLALLDADDLWLPEKLAKHVNHLDSSPEVGVSFSCSAFIDDEGQPLGIYQIPQFTNITPPIVLCRNPIGNGSAPVIRREVFAAIKFQDNLYGEVEDFYFDENFRQSEDMECWMRIILQTSWQMEGIAEVLTLYRVNSGGLSANVLTQLEFLEKVIEKTRSYAPEFIAKWKNPAMAYYLRYSARRAIGFHDGVTAVQLTHQALATHWQILLEEPRRTLLTLMAAYSIWILPKSFYQQVEQVALKMTGASQKRRLQQNKL